MIATKDITFEYSAQTAFRFPDLLCQPGEVLLITGNSGKGKTTLLHLLGGLLKPKSGALVVGETHIEKLSDNKLDQFRGKNIGLILQQPHFVEALTVLENVVLASWLASGKKASAKAKSLLEQLGLTDQMHKLPSQLSIGQQQRVSIVRALINEPLLLLADEPTSSLDDDNAQIVADLLSDLSQQYQAALVVVTHDHRLKARFSNQIHLS